MPGYLDTSIFWLWVAWLVSWRISALRVKPVARTESRASRCAHFVPMLIAAVLILMPRTANWLGAHALPWYGWSRYYSGVAIVALGFAFAVWARVTLGGNWSGAVTVKQDHELICTGPYRWVRHPIYTGVLAMFIGTALAQNQWRSVVACIIVWLSFWQKWRIEERFMRETFGDAYAKYRARTPALVPGWPVR